MIQSKVWFIFAKMLCFIHIFFDFVYFIFTWFIQRCVVSWICSSVTSGWPGHSGFPWKKLAIERGGNVWYLCHGEAECPKIRIWVCCCTIEISIHYQTVYVQWWSWVYVWLVGHNYSIHEGVQILEWNIIQLATELFTKRCNHNWIERPICISIPYSEIDEEIYIIYAYIYIYCWHLNAGLYILNIQSFTIVYIYLYRPNSKYLQCQHFPVRYVTTLPWHPAIGEPWSLFVPWNL